MSNKFKYAGRRINEGQNSCATIDFRWRHKIYESIIFWWNGDLFLTFTCNPKWPEIRRILCNLNLTASDRPDLISRVFRIKFDQLLTDLTKNHFLGKVIACKNYKETTNLLYINNSFSHVITFICFECRYVYYWIPKTWSATCTSTTLLAFHLQISNYERYW